MRSTRHLMDKAGLLTTLCLLTLLKLKSNSERSGRTDRIAAVSLNQLLASLEQVLTQVKSFISMMLNLKEDSGDAGDDQDPETGENAGKQAQAVSVGCR